VGEQPTALADGAAASAVGCSPTALRRAAGPLGTGLFALGSRISRKLNNPEIAARRRLIVLGANPRARPLANGITLSCWPLRRVVRHAAR